MKKSKDILGVSLMFTISLCFIIRIDGLKDFSMDVSLYLIDYKSLFILFLIWLVSGFIWHAYCIYKGNNNGRILQWKDCSLNINEGLI